MSTISITPEISQKSLAEKQAFSYSFFDYLGIASGIVFVILFMYASGLTSDPPTESHEAMADFYRKNLAAVLSRVYLRTLAFMFFLYFTCTLSDLTRRKSKGSGLFPNLILATGSLASVLMIVGQACEGVAGIMADRNVNPELVRAMDEISHIVIHLFTAPVGFFLLAVTAAILLYRIVPKWISILSGLSGLTLLVAAGTFDSQLLMHSIGVLALLAYLIWTIIISIALLWKMARK